MVERYEGSVSLYDLQQVIKKGEQKYQKRLTHTRSLCYADVAGQRVWFVFDRPKKRAVTVLSEEQAIRKVTGTQGLEERKARFLELCDLTGAPVPKVIRRALADDPCDFTSGEHGGEVRFNIRAANDAGVHPDWHVAHVFGHWLADCHQGAKQAQADTVANVIGRMVAALHWRKTPVPKGAKPCPGNLSVCRS